jgi:uncharacterized protein (DUF427 family)
MRSARATWNGVTLAESDRVVMLEGNAYFPRRTSTTTCWWRARPARCARGRAWRGYYTVMAGGELNPDAAWHYPNPSPLARKIKGHVAFWRGVRVEAIHPQRGQAAPRRSLLGRLLGRAS